MLRYALVFLISCFVLTATAARAAELTGFGSIKFGMTKKEAMAAINGEGRWETDDRLEYSYFWKEFDKKFTVQQFFRNGRAIATKVFDQAAGKPFWYTCVSDTLRIVSAIKEKYQITPLIRNGLKNQMRLSRTVDRFTTDTYLFGFDGGAFIDITNWMSEESEDCELTILYYPAHVKPHPF
jgi:hypothetical protein